ncbi:MAG: 4Fe-4S binding protein [Phycisphaerales bacterium]|nr:4Fe-4S binding protein [Phycisphaerales bacterium]
MSGHTAPSTGVSLRVVPEQQPVVIGWGRRWGLRLGVLVAVQIAMILHVLIWWIGVPWGWETLSPVEPSESIETVSDGIINAGAIFFAVALLSTALLGRWFCGWGCHIVLLQDWCLRMLSKAGIRPRAFRSRLLRWAPLLLAAYMFLWPVFYRLVVAPYTRPDLTWPGFHLELLTRDLWATMPGFWVSVVFLFICGFVTVYVLGAKGFCTYACPYGGFFAPLDRFSVRRVVASDMCEGCGRCTAVCTSNVRVHEQVAAYGRVIDVGCMKTTDCIDACPLGALSMQWSRPAITTRLRDDATRPQTKWDVSWAGEITLALLMLFFFLAWRGAYGLVPALLSLGAASVLVWMLWKCWRMLGDTNASFHRWSLKRAGRLTGGGMVFLLATIIVFAATAQAGASHLLGWKANRTAKGFRQQITSPLRAGTTTLSPEEHARAREALDWYRLAGSLGGGGIGMASDPNDLHTSARIHAQLGELEKARVLLDQIEQMSKPNEQLALERFMIGVSLDSPNEVLQWVDDRLVKEVRWSNLRATAVRWSLARGDLAAAGRLSLGPEAQKYAALGSLQRGNLDAAIGQLRQYTTSVPQDALAWATLGQVLLVTGDIAGADEAITKARATRSSLDAAAMQDLDTELEAYAVERKNVTSQDSP